MPDNKRLPAGFSWNYFFGGMAMTVINLLQAQGCLSKEIHNEVNPDLPTYWSRHEWDFGGEHTGKVKLTLNKFIQNGREVLVGFMPLGQVDALSGVPSFHPGISNEQVAELALYPESNSPYQRPPDTTRFDGIQEFAAEQSSILLNPITLHLPTERLDSGMVKVIQEDDEKIVLEVDLKAMYLPLENGYYTDVNEITGQDYRPFHATDGQHRKLSCQLDEQACLLNTLVVFAPLGTSTAEAAEIFTNSNVTQEPLKPLHMLYQRYAYYLPHRNSEKDYGDPDRAATPSIQSHRLANRSAYELAALHSSHHGSPLFGRIQMMELPGRRMGRNCAITAKKFVSFARKWFLDSGIYEGRNALEVFSSSRRYFSAWRGMVDTDVNGEYYRDVVERWDVNTGHGLQTIPYITNPLAFEVIMMLFPMIYKNAVQRSGGNPPTRGDFQTVLTPFQSIEWGDFETIKDRYKLDKDTPNNLYAWCAWAISNYLQTGQVYDSEEVWNPDTRLSKHCLPGRGFFSPPSQEMIKAYTELPSTGIQGLLAGDSLTLWSSPLWNVHRKPMLAIHLLDENDSVVYSSTNTNSKRGADLGFSRHIVKFEQSISRATQLRAIVNIANVNGEAQLERVWPLAVFSEREEGSFETLADEQYEPLEFLEMGIPEGEEALVEHKQERFALVESGEDLILPPPKANSTTYTTTKIDRVPQFATIEQCPLCRHGIDHNNNNCIGRTVDGYIWRY